MTERTDLAVIDHGSFCYVKPLHDAAAAQLRDTVASASWQWSDDGVAVEHRYIGGLIERLRADGLTFRACEVAEGDADLGPANLDGVTPEEIDLALYEAMIHDEPPLGWSRPNTDGHHEDRVALYGTNWWNFDQPWRTWIAREVGLKFCTKCNRILTEPQLAPAERELCERCAPGYAPTEADIATFKDQKLWALNRLREERAAYLDKTDTAIRGLVEDLGGDPASEIGHPNAELHYLLRVVTDWAADHVPRDAESAAPIEALLKRARDALAIKPRACLTCDADVRQGGNLERAVRDALAATSDERCCDGCPGWVISDAGRGPEIERCDECAPRHVLDDDVATLTEARLALLQAWMKVLGTDGVLGHIRVKTGRGWELGIVTGEDGGWPNLVLTDAHGRTLVKSTDPLVVEAFLDGVGEFITSEAS